MVPPGIPDFYRAGAPSRPARSRSPAAPGRAAAPIARVQWALDGVWRDANLAAVEGPVLARVERRVAGNAGRA